MSTPQLYSEVELPPASPALAAGNLRPRRSGTARTATSVELTVGERAALDALRDLQDTSRGDILRRALRAFAETHGVAVSDLPAEAQRHAR